METEAAEVMCPSLEISSNKQPIISNVFGAILFIGVAIQLRLFDSNIPDFYIHSIDFNITLMLDSYFSLTCWLLTFIFHLHFSQVFSQ